MSTGPGERESVDRAGRVTLVTDRLWTVPNLLSIVRLLLIPVFLWLLVERELAWAGLLLIVSGITDYADGKIARHYGLVSKVGQVLDPIADRLYITVTIIGLATIGVIPWWLVAVLVLRDAAIAAMYPLVRRHRLAIPEVDFTGKFATACLLAGFPLLLLAEVEGWWVTLCLALGWALVWWGTVVYWVTAAIYAWQVRHMVGQRRALEAGV